MDERSCEREVGEDHSWSHRLEVRKRIAWRICHFTSAVGPWMSVLDGGRGASDGCGDERDSSGEEEDIANAGEAPLQIAEEKLRNQWGS
jgi:hypothetical protein